MVQQQTTAAKVTHTGTNLFHCVSFSQCRCRWRLVQRVKVDGDCKWNGNLIRASITSTNGNTARVNFVRNVQLRQSLS